MWPCIAAPAVDTTELNLARKGYPLFSLNYAQFIHLYQKLRSLKLTR